MNNDNNIILRPLSFNDLNDIMTWVNDSEVIKNLQHFSKKLTREDESNYINRILESQNDYIFSIIRKDGVYLGQCGLHQISWENKLSRMAIIIKREFWGMGYAQKAIRELLAFSFQNLKLHKVWLLVYSTNKKARHIYDKIGFKEEGVLRDEYFWQGKYHDMVRMSIIESERKAL